MSTDEPPKVFLRYEPLRPKTAEGVLSPVFERQKELLTEVPVVTTTDKVLDCVLPPREWQLADGTVMIQRVDQQQVSREQLSDLRDMFEFKLADAKARKAGVCPVRQAIYAMLFDEIVRQTTIDNSERGLLLARIRDELRMTRDAYTTLYEASVNYSTRKMYEATKNLPEMRERMGELRQETDVLKKELSRLQAKHGAMLRCVEEQQQAEAKKHNEERLFLERTKQRLQSHLDSVKAAQEAERRAIRGEEEPVAA
jgi:dynein light intermediate chain